MTLALLIASRLFARVSPGSKDFRSDASVCMRSNTSFRKRCRWSPSHDGSSKAEASKQKRSYNAYSSRMTRSLTSHSYKTNCVLLSAHQSKFLLFAEFEESPDLPPVDRENLHFLNPCFFVGKQQTVRTNAVQAISRWRNQYRNIVSDVSR
ncbi:hypothetical protein SBC2_09860 [Caballeronia sp. SBC2]|nr:hypothetical protein SBC2_09860 [Caballeronia sp. SBC2]